MATATDELNKKLDEYILRAQEEFPDAAQLTIKWQTQPNFNSTYFFNQQANNGLQGATTGGMQPSDPEYQQQLVQNAYEEAKEQEKLANDPEYQQQLVQNEYEEAKEAERLDRLKHESRGTGYDTDAWQKQMAAEKLRLASTSQAGDFTALNQLETDPDADPSLLLGTKGEETEGANTEARSDRETEDRPEARDQTEDESHSEANAEAKKTSGGLEEQQEGADEGLVADEAAAGEEGTPKKGEEAKKLVEDKPGSASKSTRPKSKIQTKAEDLNAQAKGFLDKHLGVAQKYKEKYDPYKYIQDSSIGKRAQEIKDKATAKIKEKTDKAKEQLMEKSGANKLKEKVMSKLPPSLQKFNVLDPKAMIKNRIRQQILIFLAANIPEILIGLGIVAAIAFIFGIILMIIILLVNPKNENDPHATPLVDSEPYTKIEWFMNWGTKIKKQIDDGNITNMTLPEFFDGFNSSTSNDNTNSGQPPISILQSNLTLLLTTDGDDEIQYYGWILQSAVAQFDLAPTELNAELVLAGSDVLVKQFYPCYKAANDSNIVLPTVDRAQLLFLDKIYDPPPANNNTNMTGSGVTLNDRVCRFMLKLDTPGSPIPAPIFVSWYVNSTGAAFNSPHNSNMFDDPHNAGNALDLASSNGQRLTVAEADQLMKWFKDNETAGLKLRQTGLFPLSVWGGTSMYIIRPNVSDPNSGKLLCAISKTGHPEDLNSCKADTGAADSFLHIEFPRLPPAPNGTNSNSNSSNNNTNS